jgi:hypothetical protein
MEAIGIIVLVVGLFVGLAYVMKHQKTFTYWMSTPHYNKEYRRKMVSREIEDLQEELDRLDKEEK